MVSPRVSRPKGGTPGVHPLTLRQIGDLWKGRSVHSEKGPKLADNGPGETNFWLQR